MKVHQSMASDCLLQMQYKIEQPAFYGGSVRAIGTAYHKALENYAQIRIGDPTLVQPNKIYLDMFVDDAKKEFLRVVDGGTSHPSEEDKEVGGFIWDEDVPDVETAHGIIELMVRAYFDGEHYYPANWRYIATEQKFDLPWFGPHRRGGSIDLTIEDPNGFIVVDDQKTVKKRKWNKGKENPRRLGQGPWYAWAARELWPGAPGYRVVYSIMGYGGEFDRRIADPEERHINATAQRMADTVQIYLTARGNGLNLPGNPTLSTCSPRYCDYFSICPHGSVVD